MGVMEGIMAGIENIFVFLIVSTMITFCAGMWFAVTFANTKIFWWPVYALFLVLFLKVIMDLARGH